MTYVRPMRATNRARPVLSTISAVSALLVLTVATAASADPTAEPGESPSSNVVRPEAGLRLAYGQPAGRMFVGEPIRDAYAGQVLLQGDMGARTGGTFVGLFLQAGWLSTKSDGLPACSTSLPRPTSDSCVAYHYGAGAQVMQHVSPELPIDPWLGLGFGFDITHVDGSRNGVSLRSDNVSSVFAKFEAGLDLGSDTFALGPFISWSFGTHLQRTYQELGAEKVIEHPTTALHNWLLLGIRGAYTKGG